MKAKNTILQLSVVAILLLTLATQLLIKIKKVTTSPPKNQTNTTTKVLPSQTESPEASISAQISLQPGINTTTVKTESGQFAVNLVILPKSEDLKMLTLTAQNTECLTDCVVLPAEQFIKSRENTVAAISGTEFCPSGDPECTNNSNSFKLPIYNSEENKWINSGNLNDNLSLIYQNGSNIYFTKSATDYRNKVASAITGTGLLNNSEPIPTGSVNNTKNTKTAIGLNQDFVFLLAAQEATLNDLAEILKVIGAENALYLNSGGSTALWYNEFIIGPGRDVPNAIIFTR